MQLTHAEARLRELRSRSDSATSYRAMGHDFNNILASILGFVELARESPQDGEIEEIDSHLVEVKIAGERGRDTVAAMLAFARGGAHVRFINIADPIAETGRLASGMMPCDVQLELKLGAVLPSVSIDADGIGQICLQLCVREREPRGDSGIVHLELATVHVSDFASSTCGDRYEHGESVRLTAMDSCSRPPSGPAEGVLGTPPMQENSRLVDTLSNGGVEDLVHGHRGHLFYSGQLNLERKVDVYLPVARLQPASV